MILRWEPKRYVIGAPKGLEFSITDGLISQVRQESGTRFLQFTCPASPGNSGGPLLNAEGKVIGIVSFRRRDGQNLNFAFPISYALGLDRTLPTQPWEAVKPEKQMLPNLEVKRPEPLPLPEFKAPPAKRNTLKLKVPKKEPYTLRRLCRSAWNSGATKSSPEPRCKRWWRRSSWKKEATGASRSS